VKASSCCCRDTEAASSTSEACSAAPKQARTGHGLELIVVQDERPQRHQASHAEAASQRAGAQVEHLHDSLTSLHCTRAPSVGGIIGASREQHSVFTYTPQERSTR